MRESQLDAARFVKTGGGKKKRLWARENGGGPKSFGKKNTLHTLGVVAVPCGKTRKGCQKEPS